MSVFFCCFCLCCLVLILYRCSIDTVSILYRYSIDTVSIQYRYCIDTASIQYQNKQAKKMTKKRAGIVKKMKSQTTKFHDIWAQHMFQKVRISNFWSKRAQEFGNEGLYKKYRAYKKSSKFQNLILVPGIRKTDFPDFSGFFTVSYTHLTLPTKG